MQWGGSHPATSAVAAAKEKERRMRYGEGSDNRRQDLIEREDASRKTQRGIHNQSANMAKESKVMSVKVYRK